MIKFLNWLAGLRPTPCMKMVPVEPDPPGPPLPAPSSKPEPPAGPLDTDGEKFWPTRLAGRVFVDGVEQPSAGGAAPGQRRSAFISYAEAMKGHKQAVADSHRLRASAPPPLDGSLQRQVRDIWHDMQARALAEQRDASLLWEIAESLASVVAAEQGSIPPPPKPQPTGGRQIRIDVDPEPAPSPLLMAVRRAIDDEPFGDEPRAVLLVVAKWLRTQGAYTAVALLEREAGE